MHIALDLGEGIGGAPKIVLDSLIDGRLSALLASKSTPHGTCSNAFLRRTPGGGENSKDWLSGALPICANEKFVRLVR